MRMEHALPQIRQQTLPDVLPHRNPEDPLLGRFRPGTPKHPFARDHVEHAFAREVPHGLVHRLRGSPEQAREIADGGQRPALLAPFHQGLPNRVPHRH